VTSWFVKKFNIKIRLKLGKQCLIGRSSPKFDWRSLCPARRSFKRRDYWSPSFRALCINADDRV